MPKALLVSPTGILGGAERHLHSVATFFVGEGWDVTFLIMSRGEQTGWEDLQKHENFRLVVGNSPSEKRALPVLIASLIRLSKTENYDYILSSHAHINALLSLLRKTRLIRTKFLLGRESTFIFDRFSGLKRAALFSLYRYCYGSHDLLVCQTSNMKESLESALGFKPAKKLAVIPNPVDLQRIDLGLMSRDDEPATQKDLKTIVFCGRLVQIKGVDVLIKAFSELVQKGNRANLVIVGDGPEKNALTELALSLGVGANVLFLGHRRTPSCVLQGADLGVISSEKEGFPNVILEMMASGVKAIVSTPCTDGLSLLPNVTIAKEYSVRALSSAMSEALSSGLDSSDEYRRYVENNRSVSAFWSEVESELRD